MEQNYIELSDLQARIRERIGFLEAWVRVEIESHREVSGHHYLNVLEKSEEGEILAKASARIWRSSTGIITSFRRITGKGLEPGLSVVVRAKVEYHPQYGLTLIISDIDASFTIGRRELEKKETIKKLTDSGLMDKQKGLSLPYFPTSIAVISSGDAAGYGDFTRHIAENQWGFRFNCTLFQSLMQGENAPLSILRSLDKIIEEGRYDLVLILRGGGAESDLFCYDDYNLCRAIALSPLPVITAIGHERDFHIADMVSYDYCKTPTALADALVEWALDVETQMTDALDRVWKALMERITAMSSAVDSAVKSIKFAIGTRLNLMDSNIAVLDARIQSADPRRILKQGYVLAVDKNGAVLKNVRSKAVGDDFALRFNDGLWNCEIKDIKEYDKSGLHK